MREWYHKQMQLPEYREKRRQYAKRTRQRIGREVLNKRERDSRFRKWLRTRNWTERHYKYLLSKGCALCGKTKHLVKDHCHRTGKARGILCANCNRMLGWYEKRRKTIEKYVRV